MNLTGKSRMTVLTTARKGLQEINDYLTMMLCATGANVITDIGACETFPKVLIDSKNLITHQN